METLIKYYQKSESALLIKKEKAQIITVNNHKFAYSYKKGTYQIRDYESGAALTNTWDDKIIAKCEQLTQLPDFKSKIEAYKQQIKESGLNPIANELDKLFKKKLPSNDRQIIQTEAKHLIKPYDVLSKMVITNIKTEMHYNVLIKQTYVGWGKYDEQYGNIEKTIFTTKTGVYKLCLSSESESVKQVFTNLLKNN